MQTTDFSALVGEHQSMVFSIAWNFLHDLHQAEELAQDVFFALYRNLPRLESAAHVKNWLRRAITNRCIDLARHNGRFQHSSLESVPEPPAAQHESDPLLSAHLRKLVAGLPPRHRMVVVLRFQEDLEPSEIAETLEIPLGTVKSTLHRAIALLRSKMDAAKGVTA
jgi:RNA polymerase sigma-70 factor (ECF subfamily)